MESLESKSLTIELLANMLEYPQEDFYSKITRLNSEINSSSDNSINPLKEFLDFANTHKIEELQEFYVKTFDVNPICSLYASIHLFGEESFKRSDFMARLKQAYHEYGMPFDEKELPDFIPIILKFTVYLKDEKRLEDFIKRCILKPLKTMIETLKDNSNPYKSLMEYIRIFTEKNLSHSGRANYA